MSDTQFDDEILDSNAISPTDEEGNPVPVTIPIALAPGVTVVYTTRLGGVSHGDFGDCNLGGKGGDDPQAILANRVSLAKSVGCGLSLVSQVHSGRAVDVDASWHLNTPFGFDVSGTPGEVTADGEELVLLKGGHSDTDADDLLTFPDGTEIWFPGKRIANPNTHGTGCTLSSAIAANLAKGFALEEAIARAKAYLTDALNAQLDLGHGSGPLDHTLGGVGVENWMHGVPDAVHK